MVVGVFGFFVDKGNDRNELAGFALNSLHVMYHIYIYIFLQPFSSFNTHLVFETVFSLTPPDGAAGRLTSWA